MNDFFDIDDWVKQLDQYVSQIKSGETEIIRQQEAKNKFNVCLAELFIHNATLWGYEDEVRRTDITDAEIVRYKRLVDRENQLRNDSIDQADAIIRDNLQKKLGTIDSTLPLNTETPGSTFDRLTILALRSYHLEVEVNREDASPEHQNKCREKLQEVKSRIKDLGCSLDQLLVDIMQGHKGLKNYNTHKLYNDPETNPAVRKAAQG